MARTQDASSIDKFRSRYYSILLYKDNITHLRVFDIILNSQYSRHCLWICHTGFDENGKEIIHGSEKSHYHVFLLFSDARWSNVIAKDLGFLNPDGTCDYQFLRPVTGKKARESIMLYPTHIMDDSKVQYKLEDVHGAPDLVDECVMAHNHFCEKNMNYADAGMMCIDFITRSVGRPVRAHDLAAFAYQNGVWKGLQQGIVRDALREHNQACYAAMQRLQEMKMWNERQNTLVLRIANQLHAELHTPEGLFSCPDAVQIDVSPETLAEFDDFGLAASNDLIF